MPVASNIDRQTNLRKFLLATSCIGVILFGAAYLAALFNPVLVERAARELVRIEMERQLGEKIATLSDAHAVALADKVMARNKGELAEAHRDLAAGVSDRIARIIEEMQDPACTCRALIANYLRTHDRDRVEALTRIQEKLTGLIQQAYASVSTNLIKEFKVVSLSNAVAFSALWLVSYFRRRAALQLALPAVVLIGAAGITLGLYLFNQNWLHTIVFADYMGWAYSGYLAVVTAFLADVVFNRARLSTQLVNATLNALGAVAQAVPC